MYVNKKTQQSEKMRARLMATGRRLFETKGYEGVSAEEIVAAAGVTRGALYHHYNGKEGLFAAVVERSMDRLHRNIARDAGGAGAPRETLLAATASFLARTRGRRIQQLLFVDAPAVLGWTRWRALDAQYGLGGLIAVIDVGAKAGEFQSKDAKVAGHLLLGAMIEGALLIAAHPGDEAVRSAIEKNLQRWIDEL